MELNKLINKTDSFNESRFCFHSDTFGICRYSSADTAVKDWVMSLNVNSRDGSVRIPAKLQEAHERCLNLPLC